MRALATFEASSQNELTILRGEWVEVIERHETGWTFGKRRDAPDPSQNHEGWFPDWVVQTRQSQ